ncbi:unnamed protein product [Protopolystoma xenopodis]|uniref:Uncharacterized protein n=1 Tax=Protopolystoma xenopodis TaxID=117903 RepID=A0A3S5A6Z2_9PLAT|nr:unnamed protein product [Protopolystoma xenopodis]
MFRAKPGKPKSSNCYSNLLEMISSPTQSMATASLAWEPTAGVMAEVGCCCIPTKAIKNMTREVGKLFLRQLWFA